LTASTCQRWRARRDSYRPAGEPINTSKYGVELLIDDTTPRRFVETHHYSGSFVAARCRVGLYRMRQLVGVAVFSVPAQAAALTRWCGTPDSVELGRFVLLDDVPANGESWFLARAFEVLAGELEVRAVLSYSDPVPRSSIDGAVVTPGHVGTIYQATNGRYVGRSSARKLWLDPFGRAVAPRSLSKIRLGERGAGKAYDRLVALGAPPIRHGESASAWVTRALLEGPFRQMRHPGNHAYVFAVGEAVRRTRTSFPDALPYPKLAEAA
jgi:hypothetical protein